MEMVLCGGCGRHVMSTEQDCPFCGARVGNGAVKERKNWRTLRWGAALAVVATEACTGPVALYGPAPVDDGGVSDAGISSSSSSSTGGVSSSRASSAANSSSATQSSSAPVVLYGPGPVSSSSASGGASSATNSSSADASSAPVVLYGPGPVSSSGGGNSSS